MECPHSSMTTASSSRRSKNIISEFSNSNERWWLVRYSGLGAYVVDQSPPAAGRIVEERGRE